MIDLNKLNGILPGNVIAEIPTIINKFEINTPLRLAHFLAQASHESGGFRSLTENLNYSADGLKRVFGKYFKQQGLAESYARKPELIASRVYANRMGNGDEGTREGWKYRGRGFLQCTGKNNYKAFSDFIGEDCVSNPDLLANKYPLSSAGWFFHKNGINSISDRGPTDEVVGSVTRKVNGGTNGLSARIHEFYKFYNTLTK